MKINFDDIITKANARKDALIGFSNQVNQAHLLLRDIQGLHAHLSALMASIKALDSEARSMVGEPRLIPLQRLAEGYASFFTNAQCPCGVGASITPWGVLNRFADEADQQAQQASD